MIWIINADSFAENIDFWACPPITINKFSVDKIGFSWKWGRKSWLSSQFPLFMDFGNRGIHIRDINIDFDGQHWMLLVEEFDELFQFNRAKIVSKAKVINKYFK